MSRSLRVKLNKKLILFLVALLVIAVAATAFAFSIGTIPGGQDKKATEKKETEQDKTKISKGYEVALREKAAELEKREKDIVRREQEVAFLEQDILKRMKEIEDERAKLNRDKEKFEKDKKTFNTRVNRVQTSESEERIQQVVNVLKNVKAAVAANQIVALYGENKNTALQVLSRMDARTLGKIFSKLTDTRLAAKILEDLKEWRTADAGQGAILTP